MTEATFYSVKGKLEVIAPYLRHSHTTKIQHFHKTHKKTRKIFSFCILIKKAPPDIFSVGAFASTSSNTCAVAFLRRRPAQQSFHQIPHRIHVDALHDLLMVVVGVRLHQSHAVKALSAQTLNGAQRLKAALGNKNK